MGKITSNVKNNAKTSHFKWKTIKILVLLCEESISECINVKRGIYTQKHKHYVQSQQAKKD